MSTEQSAPFSRFVGTANHGFALYAQDEIRRIFAGVKIINLLPNEAFLIELPFSKDDAVNTFRKENPVFLRHIQPVDVILPISRTLSDLEIIQNHITQLNLLPDEKVAIQIRKDPSIALPYSPFDVKEYLNPILSNNLKINLVARQADKIISIFLLEDTLLLGMSHPLDNLSDWSGGAIRFKREENQISRAKFKLLEAEDEFKIDFSKFNHALDIGAAPGGWTSLLLERGLQVTAVDPAEIHPSIRHHRHLKYLQKNASDVSFDKDTFDLLVCDMSWSPRQMARLVNELLEALRQGGVAIITIKLMHKKPFQTVKETCKLLSPQLTMIRAKQLFHNREELTIHFIKN